MNQIILPTKTKIAAWWMTIIGGVSLGISLFALLYFSWLMIQPYRTEVVLAALVAFFFMVPCGLAGILVFPGVSLLRRGIQAWKFTIIILSTIIIVSIIIYIGLSFSSMITVYDHQVGGLFELFFGILFVIVLPPLILLLLDKKNLKI